MFFRSQSCGSLARPLEPTDAVFRLSECQKTIDAAAAATGVTRLTHHDFRQRKIFGRYQWRTQVDITNLTNHYKISLTPNNGFGYTRPANIGVRWDGQPRTFAWSNTISF